MCDRCLFDCVCLYVCVTDVCVCVTGVSVFMTGLCV